jgi:hypothetical protein
MDPWEAVAHRLAVALRNSMPSSPWAREALAALAEYDKLARDGRGQ